VEQRLGLRAYSYGGLAAPIYFASTGTQTIRVQVREDGVSLDQIVLSADRYLTVSPGASKNDSTIVVRRPVPRHRLARPARSGVRAGCGHVE